MGCERLKICEWVKDALAISKIRIASWFTRLSMVRLNDTFLDLIKFHYTNILNVFSIKNDKNCFFDIENEIKLLRLYINAGQLKLVLKLMPWARSLIV